MNREKSRFFDSQIEAPWAASEYNPEELHKIGRMLTAAHVGKGMRVIEPGSGTGRLTAILADLVAPQGFVFAADTSEKMTATARKRVGERPNLALKNGSIEGYDFAPQSFDVVVCHNVFPHFDDKRKTVAHLTAALREGGRFIVFHFMNSDEINDLHRKTDASVMSDFMPPEHEMRAMLREFGLEVDLFSDDEAGYLLCARRTHV